MEQYLFSEAGPSQKRIPTEAGEPPVLTPREPEHVPVLLQETIEFLNPGRGGLFIDATVGLAGHATAILDSSPDTRLLAIDRDAESLAIASRKLERFGDRVELIHSDYRRLESILAERGHPEVQGIVADLGISSFQLGVPDRGFAFSTDGPLDMRMDRSRGRTAASIIEDAPQEEIARILYEYGEERNSRRIARAIVLARREKPIRTTRHLAETIASASRRGPKRIHPATRSFQALRIAVNNELDGLDNFVESAAQALAVGGRIAVLTFHSLEDRILKTQMRKLISTCSCPKSLSRCVCGRPNLIRLLNKKPVTPSDDEIFANPRSRSAKLRAAERI